MTYGKLAHEWDERTISFDGLIYPAIRSPSRYDFEKARVKLPNASVEDYKADVVCSQANQLLRFQRLQQRRTVKIGARDIVRQYKRLTGAAKPGDSFDKGCSALRAMKLWRNDGFEIDGIGRSKITAFGEVDPSEQAIVRSAIFGLHGIHFGFWLPRAVRNEEQVWDYTGQGGREWQPGTLGGQMAYCKAYTQMGYEILSGNRKILVTNEFMEKYCDEAWVVIQDIALVRQVLDVQGLAAAVFKATGGGTENS